jgi:multiple sugar transport system substrate-binding protein
MSTSRRGFLKLAGLGAIGAAIGPRPASAQGKTLTVLHESSFIPPFDEYIKTTLAEAYQKETGVKVLYEVTAVGSLPTRIGTITETGSGADVTMNGLLQVIQFGEKYLDVTDLCKEIGDKNGGWYDAGREAVVVDGKWKAVPFCNIGQLMNWRTDWFAEVGVKKFPETWEELYEVGKKLKAKDHPFGFELGHGFGDNHGWLYPLLWSYGGAEVAADGKTVVIDSDETARAVDFARKFFQDTMFEDVLGWTDVSNNKAWMAEQISCTNNAESILWFAKRNFPDIAKVTDQAQNPAGPKGRYHLLDSISHSILNFSPVRSRRSPSCAG